MTGYCEGAGCTRFQIRADSDEPRSKTGNVKTPRLSQLKRVNRNTILIWSVLEFPIFYAKAGNGK